MNEQEKLTNTEHSMMFCPSCGKSIPRKSSFCPECGAKNALANETVTQEKMAVVSENETSKVTTKESAPSKKPIIITVIAIAVFVFLLIAGLSVGFLISSNSGDSGSGGSASISGKASIEDKLESAYNTHCSSIWATLGSDGSYLEIDTNPNNIDDYVNTDAYKAIEKVNNALGLPSYLFNEMSKTNSLMGRQSEDFPDLDLTVSWSYHPDNGLVVTYKVSK